MTSFFFYPNSIAVIGATSNPKKFGNAVTMNILKNKNLECELYLISKKKQEIFGFSTFKSILDVPKNIDIAIILVPAKVVERVIDECIEKKVKGIIIVTSGFGEIDENGKKIENMIANECRKAKIRVMGPNCVGIQNTDIELNASFIQTPPLGHISMISQSGSVGCATFYEMERFNLGISKFANIGNAIDVTFDEILEFFYLDKNTQIISLYLEAVREGKKFFTTLREISINKPIIILKGGRTSIGMKAARSHTGSIATNYKILKAASDQAGAVMCETMNEFIIALKTFSVLPIPKGEKIGVLTNSGGTSVLFSDAAEIFDLKFATFSEELKNKMSPYLIPLVKKVNPLDMIASAAEEQYYQITKAMLEDENIDIVVACCVIPPFLEMKSEEHYRGVIRAWNDLKREKPVIPLFVFSENFEAVTQLSKSEEAPIFYTPNNAAYAIKLLIERKKFIDRYRANLISK